MSDTEMRPLGDRLGDGVVEVSFTLPIASGAHALAAARSIATQMGVTTITAVGMHPVGRVATRFTVFGITAASVRLDALIPEARASTNLTSRDAVEAFVEKEFAAPIRVVGACIGADAHTIGIDAILNRKGFKGDPGLEAYRAFHVLNLGAQVEPERLAAVLAAERADAALVSQIVTQTNVHIQTLSKLVDCLEALGQRARLVLVCGGPRMTHELAAELGYDAGFGAGTTPLEVAGYLAEAVAARRAEGSAP